MVIALAAVSFLGIWRTAPAAWLGVLQSLMPALLVVWEPESLAEEASYLWDRTGGSIGGLRALLSDAAIGAIIDSTEKIDRRRLEATATDYAAEEHHHTRAAMSSGSRKRGLKRAQCRSSRSPSPPGFSAARA